MATIEGTGIATPSKESSKKATAFLSNFQKKADEKFIKTYERKQDGNIQNSDFETDRYNKLKKKYGDQFSSDARSNYFSPGGGAFDERNNVQIASADLSSLDVGNSFTKRADKNLASAGSDFSGTFNESDYQGYVKTLGIRNYRGLPPTMQRMLRENYQDDVRDGRFKEGQLINQSPVKEKPSFIDQTKNLAGSIFNTVTGTQPAAASQIPGGMPSGTQFSPSGDTSFASYRMAGGDQQQQEKTVVSPTVKPQYEINRTENRPSVGGTAGTGDTSFSAYVRGGGEGQQRGIVSPVSTKAPRQTVASLPSNYKSTEAEAFRKASAFKEAQGIAKRNPNVSVGVDSKGQPRATATNNSGVARAQAAAVNRKISGKSISQVKAANRQAMRDSAAERHSKFKQTGKSTVGARRAAAKKKVQAAAKKRHAAFKKRRAARRKKKSKKK